MCRSLTVAATSVVALSALLAPTAGVGHSTGPERDWGRPIPAGWTAAAQFHGVTLAGEDTLVVRRGEHWQIRASGSAATLAQLRYEVRKGHLVVGRYWNGTRAPGKARIEVTLPALDTVTLAGSGDISVDAMDGRGADATVAGSGTLAVANVRTGSLSATLAGSGHLRLVGSATRGSITIAGSGTVDAPNLTLGNASVTIAGSGRGILRASGKVTSSVVGSGSATIAGTRDCSQSRIGSGRVTCTG